MKQGIFLRDLKADATEAVIDIVGVIGWDVGFGQLRSLIASLPESVGRVVFDIYSPGGDVWDGNAIIHEIGGMKQETVARVRVAASMATLIAVACQKRTMSANGRWLVHNPWTAAQGDAEEFEKRAKELRDAQNEAAAFYARRTGKTSEEMLALMDEERWLTADEAKAFGFVQEVDDPFDVAAYAPVRDAITAAGKWPQALADVPLAVDPVEVSDVSEQPAQPAANVEAPEIVPTPAPDAAEAFAVALDAEYQRGRADGLADGRAEGALATLAALDDEAERLRERLKAADATSRALQSRADTLAAQLSNAQKQHDENTAKLRAQIDALTKRLQAHLAGALAWEPEIETWEAAMIACGQDYAKAAKAYPKLLETYRAAQRQKGK